MEDEPSGVPRQDAERLLMESGLELNRKSSDHYGDIRGPRVVLPPSPVTRRLFVYHCPGVTGGTGYLGPEVRRQMGIGGVTHFIRVEGLDHVREAISIVRRSLHAPPDRNPPGLRVIVSEETRRYRPIKGK